MIMLYWTYPSERRERLLIEKLKLILSNLWASLCSIFVFVSFRTLLMKNKQMNK